MDDAAKRFHLHSFTPVTIRPPSRLFSLSDRFFFAGSCFSENLCRFLADSFFTCAASPFGNTYNPVSLADSLERIITGKRIEESEVFPYKGLSRHFAFHTKICVPEMDRFQAIIGKSIEDAAAFLKTAAVLVITLGTAYVFYHLKSGKAVNNCHTLPASEFERRLVRIDEIINVLMPVIKTLKEKNPGLFIVFTLSPVRHLRDSAAENSLSKAILRCAIEELISVPDTYYFPAYEIMLDELRDYRYYAGDLCHPDDAAIRYIMERFCESCFGPGVFGYLEKINRLKKALAHKPLHPDTETYAKFVKDQQEKILQLKKEYPMMKIPENLI